MWCNPRVYSESSFKAWGNPNILLFIFLYLTTRVLCWSKTKDKDKDGLLLVMETSGSYFFFWPLSKLQVAREGQRPQSLRLPTIVTMISQSLWTPWLLIIFFLSIEQIFWHHWLFGLFHLKHANSCSMFDFIPSLQIAADMNSPF